MQLNLPKNKSISITPIKAFTDNYIWLIKHKNNAILVDPGDHKPVTEVLKKNKLTLKAILITHKHHDHVGGVKDLINIYPNIDVYGPSNDFNFEYCPVKDGDLINVANLDIKFKIMETPGHTLDHIAFIDQDTLFCGDTLFGCGCGKLFEGSYSQMYNSLSKISSLPNKIKIYCGHEYTMRNINFALLEDRNNKKLLQRRNRTKLMEITLPSTLKEELETNPFMRAKNIEDFKGIRIRKDAY